MLDFVTIISKSGFILYTSADPPIDSLNNLVKQLLENRFEGKFQDGQINLEYILDNDLDVLYVVGYQKILAVKFANQFISNLQNEFRRKYPNAETNANYDAFSPIQEELYKDFLYAQSNSTQTMRTFDKSKKSQKTVASMIVDPKKPKKAESKKKARMWEMTGSDAEELDFSKPANATSKENGQYNAPKLAQQDTKTNLQMTNDSSDGNSFFKSFKDYISLSKRLTKEDLKPIMAKLRDHLTSKNVAAEISEKICDSVQSKLESQSIDSWTSLHNYAQKALEDVVFEILNPNRNINILREIQAKSVPPYVITFCGVNGVGKSTNLAKIANWLINNGMKILVVACDTFRAGAIEQLRTHVQALKSLHERGKADIKIELFERGYGKDAAGIAMQGINYARSAEFNCVLVDTAGRMQDNEPLMKQLQKLLIVNNPDLTLFVGEALVGNEAVDQLTKFNQSLGGAINGIVLTKFDTIDDQVGAAVSMTYVTGQPIVFVGVGQNYKDLKQLDAKAVTRSLMR